MNDTAEPRDAAEVRHIDKDGYECGGPHYRDPSNSGFWAWCEPMGLWISVAT